MMARQEKDKEQAGLSTRAMLNLLLDFIYRNGPGITDARHFSLQILTRDDVFPSRTMETRKKTSSCRNIVVEVKITLCGKDHLIFLQIIILSLLIIYEYLQV